MPAEPELLLVGQDAFYVVQAELDELLATNHDPGLVMQFRRLPSFDGPRGRRFRRIIPQEVSPRMRTLPRSHRAVATAERAGSKMEPCRSMTRRSLRSFARLIRPRVQSTRRARPPARARGCETRFGAPVTVTPSERGRRRPWRPLG